MPSPQQHRTRTLWLCGVLHAFTHLYQVALLPLYLLIQADLKLASVGQSTFLMTAMMLAYFIPSYPLGMLADRLSRKRLLGIGLAINGLGFVVLAWAPNYPLAVAGVVLAGLGGSFYHPAATAMIARLFPVGTGKALGLAGVGASVGFFLGPVYAGWRAASAGWRAPVLELGVLGMIGAGLFAWLAQEESGSRETSAQTAGAAVEEDRGRWKTPAVAWPRSGLMKRVGRRRPGAPSSNPSAARPEGAAQPRGGSGSEVGARVGGRSAESIFPTWVLWCFFLAASVAFALRDFAGTSMGTLSSLFLQQARGFDLEATGLALSAIFLASIVSNPLFGGLSDRGRIRWTCLVLVLAAGMVALFPRVPAEAVVPVLAVYGFFFLANYPIVEAALMESVPDAVRGRVFGLFITISGLGGNLSHGLMGRWVKHQGVGAGSPATYDSVYVFLSSLILLSLLGLPCLHAIRKRERADAILGGGPATQPALGEPDFP
ncbi:MAG: MFS transporter [Verrucomicrobia bacterium]|nr:MFS transporter [Verrucomicrobiota bacterium]